MESWNISYSFFLERHAYISDSGWKINFPCLVYTIQATSLLFTHYLIHSITFKRHFLSYLNRIRVLWGRVWIPCSFLHYPVAMYYNVRGEFYSFRKIPYISNVCLGISVVERKGFSFCILNCLKVFTSMILLQCL